MAEPITISIDVGTIHLSYCIFRGTTVVCWKIVNLLASHSHADTLSNANTPCSATVKKNGCKCAAKWSVQGQHWCSRHAPMAASEKWTNAFLNKQSKEALVNMARPHLEHAEKKKKADLIQWAISARRTPLAKPKKPVAEVFHVPTIAKSIVAEFDAEWSRIGADAPLLSDAPLHVVIENQMMDKMRTVQGMLVQYFVCKFPAAYIQFMSAINKLKDSQGPKDTYEQRKSTGIAEGTDWLTRTGQDPKWLAMLSAEHKKDDLTDCLLQGIYYMNHRP